MENQNQETAQPSNQGNNNQQYGQKSLPNSTGVLVLGIISIAMCWCYGLIGLACGIIALVLAAKAMKLIKENPSTYSESSIKNMKAGRVCAIIGTILSSLMILYVVVVFLIFGAAFSAASLWNM